jgi:DNA repair exonuclease SbcCD ATPase subunit
MSVWDDPNNFIKAEDVEGNFKIALHHGAVHKSQNDIGYTITNEHVTVDKFDGYDLTLLGDIHKYQYLDEAKTIHYPGSLIQQNHGERLSHGYTVWELPNKTSTYIEVPNDYGYVTINVNKGKIVENTTIPKKPRIRIKIEDTKAADIKKLLSVVKQKYKVQDVSLQRINNAQTSEDGETKISLGDIRDVEYQNDLIVRYIENKFPDTSDIILDGIRHLNRTTNSKIPQTYNAKNITWKPKCFEFSNMFSYGEGNKVDFTNMQGTYGLFAPNASGKSSLLDALTYCIFDKCSRSTKGTHVLNNKKKNYWCKFNFEIKGVNYFIERKGETTSRGTVKVVVDFWREVDGQKESLNGEQRDDTNKEIRKYLGQYDDFILTALSLQNNNTGFIDMKQSQRKDLLSKFLDIGIFEDLYQIAADEISEVAVLLKKLKREDFSTKLAENETELKTSESELNELNKKNTENDKLIESLNKDYTDSLQEFKTVNTTATDIEQLKQNLETFEEDERKLGHTINHQKNSLEKQQETLNRLHQVYPEFKETIIDDYNKLVELEGWLEKVNDEIDKLEVTIQHKEDKLVKLEEHEYDPNCEYCVNNVFVKDAEETKKQLKQDALVMSTKLGEQETLWEQIKELPNAKKKYEGLLELDSMIETQSNDITNTNKEIETLTTKLESTQKDISATQKDIQLYKENEQAIKHNKSHQVVVDEKKSLLDSAKTGKTKLNSRIIAKTGEVSVYKKTKQDIVDRINELKQLEAQYESYEKYLTAIKRDGVPYTLITTALPRIEQEVNNILTQLTDFTIMFQTDGKNINVYIVYDENNFWLLELTSGMEKFLSSLAIRNALISVSNLPRPNFLAIDEGLGNLDAGMLSQMFLLLDYLKSQYDFLIMISHIDATRDMVDAQININKVKGFSQISYS